MGNQRRCGCNWRGQAGGFYPSVMSGLTTTGPYFVTAAFAQGARLILNNSSRMAKRLKGATGRLKGATKRSRRTFMQARSKRTHTRRNKRAPPHKGLFNRKG